MIITPIPTNKRTLAFDNCGFLNSKDFEKYKSPNDYAYLKVQTKDEIFTITTKMDKCVRKDELQLPVMMRSWMGLSGGDRVSVEKLKIEPTAMATAGITFTISPFDESEKFSEKTIDTKKLGAYLVDSMCSHVVSVGQMLIAEIKRLRLIVTVSEINLLSESSNDKKSCGFTSINTVYNFIRGPGVKLCLSGDDNLGGGGMPSIFTSGWDFNKLGIGGLSKEFYYLFRRAFVSRMCPPDLISEVGEMHIRGILFYGPPGTGKTLLAREICKMLHTREPKIVNGPEILNKYVGQSESNIRDLFAEAEADEKKYGNKSPLHIIIFDEIDAICKKRGTTGGGTGVHDSVINQLLSKLDGVHQLNNILVIGMTNRKDMIDSAILRPGRLGVHIEIGLPSEEGRRDILNIYTQKIKACGKLSKDVNLPEIAKLCKNFSGAECEALVRAATTRALNGLVKVGKRIELEPDAHKKIILTHKNMMDAATHDIKPAYGTEMLKIGHYCRNGIININKQLNSVVEECMNLIQDAANPNYHHKLVSILLHGSTGSGKTSLAVHVAKLSKFPLVRVISAKDMIGESDLVKCYKINQIFEDAYKSHLSVVIIDSIESIIDFAFIGPRFSNSVLQAILTLLKHHPPNENRLVVIGTTSNRDLLAQLNIDAHFSHTIHIPLLTSKNDVLTVMDHLGLFKTLDQKKIKKHFDENESNICVGVKKLIACLDLSMILTANQGYENFPHKLISLVTK